MLIENIKDFCVNELREVQTDNLYFGEDENGWACACDR